MQGRHVIRLEVPGVIVYRDVALRTLSAFCGLTVGAVASEDDYARCCEHVISAVGEAYNNIALHGYEGLEPGVIRIEAEIQHAVLRVTIQDFGRSFDPANVKPPDLASLPEAGLGVFIMKSFMDQVSYAPGHPNVTTMSKRIGTS